MKDKLLEYKKLGYDKLPICMAKTANSLTGNGEIKGAPVGFQLHVSDIFVSVGAGFVVPMIGNVRMHSKPLEKLALRVYN